MSYTDQTNRKAAIKLAVQQAADGAHYLWGSRGGTPNKNEDVGFNKKDWNWGTLSFCAAIGKRNVPGGPYICCGRYERMTLAAGATNPIRTAADTALAAFKAKYENASELDWGFDLTPRRCKGAVEENVVWGEGCDGTRHFDCISLINWCISRGDPDKRVFDIADYFYSIEPGHHMAAKDVTGNDNDVMPADILIYGDSIIGAPQFYQNKVAEDKARLNTDLTDKERDATQRLLDADEVDLQVAEGKADKKLFRPNRGIRMPPQLGVGVKLHHIAFCTGNGKERVHAADSKVGVIVDKDWKTPLRRIRLPDGFFI